MIDIESQSQFRFCQKGAQVAECFSCFLQPVCSRFRAIFQFALVVFTYHPSTSPHLAIDDQNEAKAALLHALSLHLAPVAVREGHDSSTFEKDIVYLQHEHDILCRDDSSQHLIATLTSDSAMHGPSPTYLLFALLITGNRERQERPRCSQGLVPRHHPHAQEQPFFRNLRPSQHRRALHTPLGTAASRHGPRDCKHPSIQDEDTQPST